MKTIIELNRDEINNVSIAGGGAMAILEKVEYYALEIIKGASLPILGAFISYGIIRALSKSRTETE